MLRPRPSDRLARHRAVPAALALLAAATLGACGVSSGEAAGGDAGEPTTTTTTEAQGSAPEAGGELTPEEQEAADALVGLYEDFGLSEDQARCVAEGLIGSFGTEGVPDDPTAAATDIFNDCDVTAADLGGVEDSLGGESLDDSMRNSLVTAFEQGGLSPEQAECAADVYLEEFGVGGDSLTDPAVSERILEACGVDLADLLGE